MLAHYAANINLMGPSGAGQVTKLCNQVIVGSNLAVLAEAIRLQLCDAFYPDTAEWKRMVWDHANEAVSAALKAL